MYLFNMFQSMRGNNLNFITQFILFKEVEEMNIDRPT